MKVDWPVDAEDDLIDVFNYTQTKSNTKKADKTLEKIISKAELLEQFPQMGSIEKNSVVDGFNVRYLIEGNYKILYRINPKKGVIEILSVFNTLQDPSKMLSKED